MKKPKINLPKNIPLPKFDKTKIKLDKKTSLIISAGVLFFFLSQFVLSIVMYLVLANLFSRGADLNTAAIIFNIIQLAAIAASGAVVGWLAHENGLILGALAGLAVTILTFALSSIPIGQVQINLTERLVNLISNGAFIIILMAIGGKAGQTYYFKRHPQTANGK